MDIYQVVTFYKAFSLKRRGKYHIRLCLGTACYVRGSQRILEIVERELGFKNGETSKDGLFSIESVNCLGCCALGPVMMINKNYYGDLSPSKINKILKRLKEK